MKRIIAPLGLSFSAPARIWMPLLVLLLFVVSSFTQSTPSHAAPSEDDIKKVVKLSSAAAVAYDKGEFSKALTLYRKAHSLWANPKLSFAIAKSLEAMGKYKEALAAAERGLKENPKAVLKQRLTSKVTYLKQQLAKGRLTLLITPSGASISINGKFKGKAPIGTLSLPAGSHKLEISHPGYANISQGITITGGSELKQSFSLQALSGKLSVNSTPAGASVEIDGKPMGKTPLNDVDVPMGPHMIKVKYKGYQDTSRRVNISPQKSESITVVLSQISGTVPAPSAAKGPWFRSWPGWTVLALGIGAGAVGTFFLVQSSQTHSSIRASIQNPDANGPSQQDLAARWNNANTEEKVGYALVGSAGGLVILAAILFAARVGTGAPSAAKVSALPQPAPTKAVQLYRSHHNPDTGRE